MNKLANPLGNPDFEKCPNEDAFMALFADAECCDCGVIKEARKYGMPWACIVNILTGPPASNADVLALTVAALKTPAPCPPDQTPSEKEAHDKEAAARAKAIEKHDKAKDNSEHAK